MKTTLSTIFKNAHTLRSTQGLTMKAALKAAWSMYRIAKRNAMSVATAWVKPGTTEVRFYLNDFGRMTGVWEAKGFFKPVMDGTTFFNPLVIVGAGSFARRIEAQIFA